MKPVLFALVSILLVTSVLPAAPTAAAASCSTGHETLDDAVCPTHRFVTYCVGHAPAVLARCDLVTIL